MDRDLRQNFQWIVFGAILILVLVVALIKSQFRKKRVRELTEALSNLGYMPEDSKVEILAALQSLPLFASAGFKRRVFECDLVMKRRSGAAQSYVIDGLLRIGAGKNKQYHSMNLLAFHFPKENFPYFRWTYPTGHLKKKRFWHPILLKDPAIPPVALNYATPGSVSGHCEQPDQVWKIFREDRVVNLASEFQGYVEGKGQWIFAFLPLKKIKPNEIEAWVAKAPRILDLLQNRGL